MNHYIPHPSNRYIHNIDYMGDSRKSIFPVELTTSRTGSHVDPYVLCSAESSDYNTHIHIFTFNIFIILIILVMFIIVK